MSKYFQNSLKRYYLVPVKSMNSDIVKSVNHQNTRVTPKICLVNEVKIADSFIFPCH